MIDYTITLPGVPVQWRTSITAYDPPSRFVDQQLHGPYSFWYHTRGFRSLDDGTKKTDTVRYMLPMGVLGSAVHTLVVRNQVEAIFEYRAKVIEKLPHGEQAGEMAL